MDFTRILAELRQEKEAIEQAILSIEKLSGAHRPGGPPTPDTPKKRGRPKGSKNKLPTAANSAATAGHPF